MVPLILVQCPQCHHGQPEPVGTISTVCTKCRGYIAVDQEVGKKRAEMPKRSRVIQCPHCDLEQKVYADALTTICTGCGSHLNIANHTVGGKVRHSLSTFGDVTFLPRCRYAGAEVKAQNIHASGELRTKLRAYRQLVLSHHVSISGPIFTVNLEVLTGAKARVTRVSAEEVVIKGFVQADLLVVTRRLLVTATGHLIAKTLRTSELIVEPGGGLEADFESIAPLANRVQATN
jgi:cytoskeletal protein CcmA (bactofilin family)